MKTVRVRFKTEAYFDGYVEMDDEQFKKLEELASEKRGTGTLHGGSVLHTLLMDIATDRETLDYVDKDADIEDIEIDEDDTRTTDN